MPRNDNTKKLPSEKRIFDTIARVLTGNSVCVAVLQHEIAEAGSTAPKKKLFISSNKLSKKDCADLNKKVPELKPSSGTPSTKSPVEFSKGSNAAEFFELIRLLCDFAKGTVTTGQQNALKDAIMIMHLRKLEKEYGSETADDFVDFIGDFKGETAVKDSLVAAAKHLLKVKKLEFSNITSGLGFFQSAKLLQKYKTENGSNEQFFVIVDKALKRVEHDYEKLKMLKSDLREMIEAGDFFFVEPPEDKPKGSIKDNHAEMNLLKYLITEGIKGTFYFGITKLSCYGCAIDINVINKLAELGLDVRVTGLAIETRGEHNVDYNKKRLDPGFSELLEGYKAAYEQIEIPEPSDENDEVDLTADNSGDESQPAADTSASAAIPPSSMPSVETHGPLVDGAVHSRAAAGVASASSSSAPFDEATIASDHLNSQKDISGNATPVPSFARNTSFFSDDTTPDTQRTGSDYTDHSKSQGSSGFLSSRAVPAPDTVESNASSIEIPQDNIIGSRETGNPPPFHLTEESNASLVGEAAPSVPEG